MGFFGGGSSSTSSVISSIDFSPVIQFGEDQNSTQDKINRQDATVSPSLDDSTGLSASVGIAGGSGGPASTTRMQEQGANVKTESPLTIGKNALENLNPYWLIGGAGLVVVTLLLKKKKKK